ncbi:MAG: sugar phosphate isomerase/epimerase [Defluviitaleaceae bacterium]|nr:sugar phosphate isomerase/epimerase [Defluviitaleaceae bacterium]
MKFGASTFIWVSPFSNNTLDLFEKVKTMGFDVLEVCIENPDTIDPLAIKEAAQKAKIEVLICGAFGSDRDISSDNPLVSENGIEYIKKCIDYAKQVGSPLVSGPMYSAVGLTRLLPPDERKKQWQRSAENMKTVADYAEQKGIKLAVEPLNRFETDFINTVEQGLEFFKMIGYDNVGFLLDTFHMNIEEKNIRSALRQADKKIFNFHASANDRGTPGEDHLPWQDIVFGLKDVRYNKYVIIESFTTAITEIAKAVSLWRPLAESEDALAQNGLKFLKSVM